MQFWILCHAKLTTSAAQMLKSVEGLSRRSEYRGQLSISTAKNLNMTVVLLIQLPDTCRDQQERKAIKRARHPFNKKTLSLWISVTKSRYSWKHTESAHFLSTPMTRTISVCASTQFTYNNRWSDCMLLTWCPLHTLKTSQCVMLNPNLNYFKDILSSRNIILQTIN